eukprot:1141158-Pelagomonas_calceolata.AAC.1
MALYIGMRDPGLDHGSARWHPPLVSPPGWGGDNLITKDEVVHGTDSGPAHGPEKEGEQAWLQWQQPLPVHTHTLNGSNGSSNLPVMLTHSMAVWQLQQWQQPPSGHAHAFNGSVAMAAMAAATFRSRSRIQWQ